MKAVFGILVVTTFLLIGMAFVCSMAGHAPWGALFMAGAVISALFTTCAAADLLEYNPKRRRIVR